ncbi:unnamed protein product [Schistosoma margrebowiei]|uniref:Uncharacterized protein n=1 Tax=Schistosoma margrebowiei TaxID=48269 RepID=A0A183MM89_9TREM|nr:unnamed protein product [Schistosoma margrebowiei]
MFVKGSQQETLDPGFVLLGTHQQGIVVGGSQQETLDLSFVLFGTRQQGVSTISRKLTLPDGFNPVSPSFIVSNVTTELSEPRLTSCRTEMYSQLIDHWVGIFLKFRS